MLSVFCFLDIASSEWLRRFQINYAFVCSDAFLCTPCFACAQVELSLAVGFLLRLPGNGECRCHRYRGQLGCHFGAFGVNPLGARDLL